MATGITEWLSADTAPRNLYELLGRPPLDPDREGLLAALRAAQAELLGCQSHPDPAVARRVRALLLELGRARGILEDPVRFGEYADGLRAERHREVAETR